MGALMASIFLQEGGGGDGEPLQEDPATFLQDVPVRKHPAFVDTQNQDSKLPGCRVKASVHAKLNPCVFMLHANILSLQLESPAQ